MSPANCVRCGKETGEGEPYCSDCQVISATPRRKGLWIFTVGFSALVLFLTGLVLWHGGLSFGILSLDSIWGSQAAVINGESISKADLKARVKTIRGIVERQHGRDIFTGERGRELLSSLTEEILDGMLVERLMAQEARKLGIQITAEQVQQRLDQVAKENFGTWENFESKLREEGMSKEDLQNNLRSILLSEALKKAKAQEGADPEVSFNAWLMRAKQNAKLVIYDSSLGGPPVSSGGCCCSPNASPGRFGAQPGPSGPVDSGIEKQAEKAGLEAFQKSNPGEKGITAKVTDYGCHVQVDIQKDGRVVKSYSYQRGKVFEIS